MKRFAWIALAIVLGVGIVGVGVAVVRPKWLPAWARLDLGRNTGKAAARASDDAGLMCREHGVPEAFCTLCHPELKDSLLLCAEHGDIPEAICTLCHPEAKAKYHLQTCAAHDLPAAFCPECRAGAVARNAVELVDDGWCDAHGQPEATCPECAGAQTSEARACRKDLPMVHLKGPDVARTIGIRTATAIEEEHTHRLDANAEAAYDANRFAEVSPRVGGFIREVRVDLGQLVRRGEVLCVVDSAEVSSAKARYLAAHAADELARVNAQRLETLARKGAVPGKSELEARTALNQARAELMNAEQGLRNLGFSDEDIARFLAEGDTKNLLPVVAPIGGTIVARHAVPGEAVKSDSGLFTVADTTRMWLWIDVYESDISRVHAGQPVRFTISGAAPEDAALGFDGQITWVGTEVNPTTRTTRVRAEVANPQGRLRANQFGRASIEVEPPHKSVVVPRAAVQRAGKLDLVFFPESAESYRPQRVVTRPIDRSDVVEIEWGVRPGQSLVTEGGYLLKAELMKDPIGAGCCQ
jgi:cobalt-zinc-cadmium efflux system membrane fusion protein